MKIKVFESEHIQCFEYADQQLFEIVWLPSSENIDYWQIVEITEKMLEGVALCYVISDARQMGYTISPKLQAEYGQYSTQKFIEKGCKKLAVLLPEEFIANLSVQQLVDEVDSMRFKDMFEIKYFTNYLEAMAWFNR